LFSMVYTIVEEVQELVQRSVVHPIDKSHLDNTEIEH
jgi:hypothetical protein